MKLRHKLTALFLLLSILPLVLVGYLAYNNSRQAIEHNTVSRLVTTTILKETDFNRWVAGNQRQIERLAQRPLVRDYAVTLTSQVSTGPGYQTAQANLLQDHFLPALQGQAGYYELMLLDHNTGQIMASTNASFIGQQRAEEPYFIEGRLDTFVDNLRYEHSEARAVMHISTPVKDRNGDLTAVLVGHVGLVEMTDIMLQESGLNPSEKSYLVNNSNFFVTEPKYGNNFALNIKTHTAGVADCLTKNNGTGFYNDHRGVPVIGAYRWLEERELCILTEVDQAEAYAPIKRLEISILLAGGLIALTAAGLGVAFTRSTITRPIHHLVKGAQEIGQGNLSYRIPVNRSDELGQLAKAFNQMAAQRQQMENALREAQSELERRVQERTAALHKSEEKYRQLAETAQDIILTHNMNGRITYVNRAGLDLSHYSFEEITSRLITEIVAPDQAEMLLAHRNNRMLGDDAVYRFETELITKHGQAVPLEVISSLLFRNNEPDELLVLARDIRERKQAEQALANWAADLARSNAELEQFAYIVSHDLQEPLRMVTSYMQLLKRRYKDKLDQDAREFIGYAVDGANRMKALIDGLLTFSRVGTRAYPPTPIRCELIFERVLANLQLIIADKQAIITHDPLPTVMADGFQMEQLLQNLLSNALKFNEAAPPRIHVGAARQQAMWRFWVQDNGIGIEPQYLEQIFVVFKRLHTREEYSGTGIGLAVCKKIVERHGGRIWVELQPGQGTSFFFTLPAAPPDNNLGDGRS